MKWAFRNKTAEKGLKMAIFKLLVLSYMITTLCCIFLSFIRTILPSSMLCENTRKVKIQEKFESTNMGLVHFKILIFF